MCKQFISLTIVPLIVIWYAGAVTAGEVEVKTGRMQVSVQNGNVEVNSNGGAVKTPSLLERLNNIRLFRDRHSSSSQSNLKCDRTSSGYSTTRSNSSGSAVSRSTSSSTTVTCN